MKIPFVGMKARPLSQIEIFRAREFMDKFFTSPQLPASSFFKTTVGFDNGKQYNVSVLLLTNFWKREPIQCLYAFADKGIGGKGFLIIWNSITVFLAYTYLLCRKYRTEWEVASLKGGKIEISISFMNVSFSFYGIP
ncbi:unnamed protein product [Albugo candida]|uniref:Uncharacterized protein n=1 Tax=Albugo candida TaxID=65357 RepID=A0A024FU23_9STRA|nr:unnamed protein product [Albugo candida]|eukprot:CCI10653.1 unnamed protein product [Albugo candida]